MADLLTHWVPFDSPLVGSRRRALCGTLVDEGRAHDPRPSCRTCQLVLLEADRSLAAEADPVNPVDPAS